MYDRADAILNIEYGGQHPRVDCFNQVLSAYPGRSTLLDIAAGHCMFSIAAAKRGMKVTATDARRERVPPAVEKLGIEFVQADVNSPDFRVGAYDVVLLLGILYHLTLAQQIALVKKCAHTLTIVDTRCTGKAQVKIDGYEGVYYVEDEKMRQDPRSAFSSEQSFWHREPSLIRMLRQCGYRRITRVEPPSRPYRWFFVCEP